VIQSLYASLSLCVFVVKELNKIPTVEECDATKAQ